MGEAGRELVRYAVDGLMKPFEQEDLPMLEAQQRNLGDSDFWSLQPALLSLDAGAIRARRVMERLIAEERAARTEPVAQTVAVESLRRASWAEA
jgi:vanillate O-demethylase monooxygenase subunit